MNVAEVGESGLISRIAEIVNRNPDSASRKDVIFGIGDDAAAWYGDNSIQLATVDALRQGVHFELETTTWADLGWKSLAVNLSDIAAMGGIPRFALISLALPESTDIEDVVAFYEGMTELARKFDVTVIGGDTDRSPLIDACVTVLGRTKTREQPLLVRSSARVGDLIAVTGSLGAAAAGYKILTERLTFENNTAAALLSAFQRPFPRIIEGSILIENGVRTAIDVSDGLIADLERICRASRVGARIETSKIPISPEVRAGFNSSSLELALSGGEDYELLFTAGGSVIERVKNAISCPVTVIGEIITDANYNVAVIGQDGKPETNHRKGWEHFKSN
jgi:thiamine-monophosphate kinase